MHVTDDHLKALIDCVAMRLDDEMDTLGEDLDVRRVLDDRDDVKTIWSLTDLLEKLRQESRSRRRGADERAGMAKGTAGVEASNVDVGNFETGTPLKNEALAEEIRRRVGEGGIRSDRICSPRYVWQEPIERLEALVKEHEEDRMAMRAELGAAQATIGDLLALANDHREQLDMIRPQLVHLQEVVQRNDSALALLRTTMKARSKIRSRIEDGRYAEFVELQKRVNALDDRFPDTKFWGRVQNFERGLERRVNSWVAECNAVLEERTRNGELSAEALLRLTRVTEGLHEKLQALEVQADDRWVRTQQRFGGVNARQAGIELALEGHIGDGEVKH